MSNICVRVSNTCVSLSNTHACVSNTHVGVANILAIVQVDTSGIMFIKNIWNDAGAFSIVCKCV